MNGKPEPDIFLVAARELLGFNVGGPEGPENSIQKEERSKGLVLEDSLLGMQAGKRAGMAGRCSGYFRILSHDSPRFFSRLGT